MSSPFPGMDPFIESQLWEEFHTTAVVLMAEMLNPQLRGRYVARIERRVYIERSDDPEPDVIIPDVTIDRQPSGQTQLALADPGVVAVPVTCLIAMPEERRETYLLIKDLETNEVVTVIELLSPSNKRRGTGREKYLSKRIQILQSPTHLVEFDLLRGGTKMPMHSPLPPGDYHAIVSEAHRRPHSDVYAWQLQDRLPTIPLPLARNDAAVLLELQTMLGTVYNRARYDVILNYTAPLLPPVGDEARQWITEILERGPHPATDHDTM